MSAQRTDSRRIWPPRLPGWADAERLVRHENTLLLVVTLLIGTVVGLIVVAFILVTERLGARLYPASGAAWRRLAVPTAGALLSGVLLARYFPNARGSGIPQTKAALFLHGGYIKLRTVVGKFACSSISLASGVALGREGPTVHVGAGIASVLGRSIGLGPDRARALIPIGTSAALAAAFNTPIAAVLFTLEEILGDLHAAVIGSVVISSATAWAVLHLMLGDEPLFHVPAYQLVHPLELPVYGLLGIAGGLVSVVFVKLLLRMRRGFLSLPRSTVWWQPAVGGVAVGLLGWFVPDVLGVGYSHVGDALNGQLALGAMALLLALKVVATASCYASGNAGGIFGPSLFIGAMLGGAVGSVAHGWFPDFTGSIGAYALVGMGTAFAGIVRAPMTSVIMIFEITRDYSIIVPVMVANLLSYFISQRLQPEPVYEALLHQDGIQLPHPRSASALSVNAALRAPDDVATAGERVADRLAVGRTRQKAPSSAGPWPVVDGGRLLGMVTVEQLERAEAAGRGDASLAEITGVPEGPLTADSFVHVHPDQSVDVALERMGRTGLDVLPVVSRTNVRDLVGIVRLSDLPEAWSRNRAAVRPAREDRASPRTMLTAVVAGVVGLFALGGFLTHHYYTSRQETAAAFFDAGSELVRAGRDGEAAEKFRAALSLTRSDRDRLALGLALARADRGNEATVYLNEVLRSDPTNGLASLALARLARTSENASAAVSFYERAVNGAWGPEDQHQRFDAAFELVDLLEKTGNRRQAVAELLQLTGRTTDQGMLTRIGRRLVAAGSPDQAIEIFRDIIRGSPNSAAAYAGLGEAELARDEFGAARTAFERAARLDPGDPAVRDRADLCARVISLDPTPANLRPTQRYDRSRALLAAVLAAAEACPQPQDPATTAAIEQVRRLLAGTRRPRLLAEAVDEMAGLAGVVWRWTIGACGQPGDEALTRVMGRLER